MNFYKYTFSIILLLFSLASYTQTLIEDINPGSSGSNPRNFLEVSDETLYFWAEFSGDYRLFKSDRTSAGTSMLSDPTGSNIGILLESTDRVYYLSKALGSSIYHLCYISKSNDTIHNCSIIGNSLLTFEFYRLFEFQNDIYMTAFYQNQYGMFRYNENIEDFDFIIDGHGLRRPGVEMNNTLYYGWSDTLFAFDGQNAIPIKPGIDVSIGFFFNNAITGQVNGNDYLYFISDSDEIWRSDGTTAGTVKLSTPFPASGSAGSLGNPVMNNSGFYLVQSLQEGADFKTYLMSNDESSSLLDTAIRLESGLSPSNSEINYLRATQSKIFWRNEFDVVSSDGSPGGTQVIGTYGSGNLTKPSTFITIDNTLFFAAIDQNKGYELIATSGSPSNTVVYDINPGPGSSMFDLNAGIRISNDRVYLATTNGSTGVEPYYLNSIPSSIIDFPEYQVRVFPNPGRDQIFISGERKFDRAELFDMTGQKIDVKYDKYYNTIIPVKTIKGLHILKIYHDDNVITKKVIWE